MQRKIVTQDAFGGFSISEPVAPNRTVTSITTAGSGTLTAAALVGGHIARTGPSGGYTDTTDTATNILAAFPGARAGTSFEFTHMNQVAQTCTFAAGTGVTLSGTVNNAASKVRRYLAVFTNVDTPAVTIYGIGEMVA